MGKRGAGQIFPGAKGLKRGGGKKCCNTGDWGVNAIMGDVIGGNNAPP